MRLAQELLALNGLPTLAGINAVTTQVIGAFELDWNDKFLSNLIRAGYQGKTDQDIVDNWFKAVCRNVIQENFEQEQADPEIRKNTNRRDLGDGRTEVS